MFQNGFISTFNFLLDHIQSLKLHLKKTYS